MWFYVITSGDLYQSSNYGTRDIGRGYSGLDECKNNPAMCDIKDRGPIPEGFYFLGRAVDDPEHGPCAIPLTSSANNQMFNRAGFWIHGDSKEHPGQASHGCVILDRKIREVIDASDDKRLRVLAFHPTRNPSQEEISEDPI